MLRIKELYNVMALALGKVEERMDEHDFERMRNLDDTYEIALTEELKRKFPDMFDKDTRNVSEASEWSLRNSSLVEDLEMYLRSSDNKEELVFLVKCLDSFLEETFYGSIPADQEQYRFQSLNDNYTDCQIYLLPRLKCGWEHRNRNAYTSYHIDFYLRHFYYVHEGELDVYNVQHILMPRETFGEAVCRGELRVMVSPVSGDRIVNMTEPYIRDNIRFISVNPILCDEEECLKKNIIKVLEEAVLQEADILLFPEMLGTDGIVEKLGHEISDRENILNNEFPCLTVCPTVWAQHRNYCKILDDIGELVCEQQKHHGVDLKKWSAKEDIESDKMIYILHCEGIGRIAVAICKDFLITSYLRILADRLKVNLLLVPSFTGRDYQFRILAPKYGDLDCNVIWINTCSARWLEDSGEMQASVTLAYLPGNRGVSQSEMGINELCQGQHVCDGTCEYMYRINLRG